VRASYIRVGPHPIKNLDLVYSGWTHFLKRYVLSSTVRILLCSLYGAKLRLH